ncbi:MAG TPA: aminoacetone oxidase family FAD-binding enzyme [Vicinamibacterales bacterium]
MIIVGAGAAGLATAIFTGRSSRARVLLVDGAARPGAKIVVSGGSRCNVTNAVVTEHDYWGGRRTIIRRVLARLPVAQTIRFFEEIGVPLKEEPGGKLFPQSDRSRDVLDGLLAAVRDADVTLSAATRVLEVTREPDGFCVHTSRGPLRATAVVMATGGLSLPRSGSDGAGLAIAARLGHTIVPTTPALAPLLLRGGFNASVSGVSQDVDLALRVDDRIVDRIAGAMLWTHFGISGPAALDLSRHVLRARLAGRRVLVTANFQPGQTFEQVDASWARFATSRPKLTLEKALGDVLPASVAAALLLHLALDGGMRLAELTRAARRALAHALTELPIDITDSRGYNYAEATAGGVALDEIDPATMESRRCPGLYLVGEMLDVDGRLGGFNFQWAWSSAKTAAEGLTQRFGPRSRG